ncbi:hypothetical protein HMPREF0305_10400 [Corynebacterium pseudogenitalium ATCC 33035]|uniref:Uncharacterized protein n=2 Tax=Corynebacterium TaxID=1716 RepID=C6RAC6_9CORY|nr:hypothetical protein CORTU0001_1553 [Corynebacterium tuberculostearicum SK141]EFQ81514.1 hypothetical protein HMPREF0305_10400 [Corynebacterium pseudogenitalium ATCC 33035]
MRIKLSLSQVVYWGRTPLERTSRAWPALNVDSCPIVSESQQNFCGIHCFSIRFVVFWKLINRYLRRKYAHGKRV